VFGPGRCPQ
jgi:hypothetical protein